MLRWQQLANYQMIKQKKNKIITINIIQSIGLLGIFIIQYFVNKKMGVQRTLMYYSYLIENKYKLLFILVNIAFLLRIILISKKSKNLFPTSFIITIIMFGILLLDIDKIRLTRYPILVMLSIINIFQFIKEEKVNEKIK